MCNFQIGFVASCPTCKGSASLAAWLSSSQTGPQSHCHKAMSWSLLTMSPCLKCKNVHNERCSNQFYCRWRERAFWVMVWLRWTDSRACSSALPDEDTNTAGHWITASLLADRSSNNRKPSSIKPRRMSVPPDFGYCLHRLRTACSINHAYACIKHPYVNSGRSLLRLPGCKFLMCLPGVPHQEEEEISQHYIWSSTSQSQRPNKRKQARENKQHQAAPIVPSTITRTGWGISKGEVPKCPDQT